MVGLFWRTNENSYVAHRASDATSEYIALYNVDEDGPFASVGINMRDVPALLRGLRRMHREWLAEQPDEG